MYDPYQTLAQIDEHKWQIILLCTVAMVCNYTWFFASLRQAKRDRAFSVAPFLVFFWLAGDATFLTRFDKWFNTYDHWYTKLFWVALLFTVAFELAFLGQLIRYGRAELLPSWTQQQFTALVLVGAAVGIVVWAYISHVMNDDLAIIYFDLANLAGPLFAAALLIRRRSRAGHTPLIWAAYTAMAACWFVACTLWFGPGFRSAAYLSVSVVCVLASLAMFIAVRRMPEYTPALSDGPARGGAPAPAEPSTPAVAL